MIYLTLIGALVVTRAMLRHLTSWRCIIIKTEEKIQYVSQGAPLFFKFNSMKN